MLSKESLEVFPRSGPRGADDSDGFTLPNDREGFAPVLNRVEKIRETSCGVRSAQFVHGIRLSYSQGEVERTQGPGPPEGAEMISFASPVGSIWRS